MVQFGKDKIPTHGSTRPVVGEGFKPSPTFGFGDVRFSDLQPLAEGEGERLPHLKGRAASLRDGLLQSLGNG